MRVQVDLQRRRRRRDRAGPATTACAGGCARAGPARRSCPSRRRCRDARRAARARRRASLARRRPEPGWSCRPRARRLAAASPRRTPARRGHRPGPRRRRRRSSGSRSTSGRGIRLLGRVGIGSPHGRFGAERAVVAGSATPATVRATCRSIMSSVRAAMRSSVSARARAPSRSSIAASTARWLVERGRRPSGGRPGGNSCSSASSVCSSISCRVSRTDWAAAAISMWWRPSIRRRSACRLAPANVSMVCRSRSTSCARRALGREPGGGARHRGVELAELAQVRRAELGGALPGQLGERRLGHPDEAAAAAARAGSPPTRGGAGPRAPPAASPPRPGATWRARPPAAAARRRRSDPSAIAPPSRRTTAAERTAPSSSGAKTAARPPDAGDPHADLSSPPGLSPAA